MPIPSKIIEYRVLWKLMFWRFLQRLGIVVLITNSIELSYQLILQLLGYNC